MTSDEIKEYLDSGDEFGLEDFVGFLRFTPTQLEVLDDGKWRRAYIGVPTLLQKQLVRIPWIPKSGDRYHYWAYNRSLKGWTVDWTTFALDNLDLLRHYTGNCFKTSYACYQAADVLEKLKRALAQLNR